MFRNRKIFCDYPCVYRIGCSPDDLGEDDPIGWFELEEEWDEAEFKLQQCRVAKVSVSELWPSHICPLPSFYSVSVDLGYSVSALCQHWNPGGESHVIVTLRESMI